MKIKQLLFALLLTLATLTLTACFGDNPPPADDDGPDMTVYSESVSAPIVVSLNATSTETDAANYIKNAINLKVANGGKLTYDSLSPTDGVIEIVVGNTKRPISQYATGYIAENIGDGVIAYLICYRDGAICVAANNDIALELAAERFIADYVTEKSLTASEDMLVFVTYTEAEYKELLYGDRKEAELEAYDDRWAEVDAKMPEDVAKALKNYYSIYGTDIIEWFANLYDPETGAFYYSNSARDYSGFLPDIESTYQVIKNLRNAGCFNVYNDGDSYAAVANALPAEVRDKMLAFVQNMQDPDDGYFYHTQWGKNIGSERRSRDLTWAVNLFKFLDAEPEYPTALDRLQGSTNTSAQISAMMSEVHPTSSLPSYLQSREAFYAWLDTMDFEKDSHGKGHTVGSMADQIAAAGLIDDAVEYFNNLQTKVYNEMKAAYDADPTNNPEPTGLWQKEINYTSLSGLFKIGLVYSKADEPIQYADLAIKSAIKCILSDESPKTVIYAYNPWAGLGTAISSVKKANSAAKANGLAEPYDYDALAAEVMASAAQMINKTTEKFLLFKKDDGSFSYYQDYAAPSTQGTYVSLGINEGDVNATTVAMDGAASIFGALGLTKPQNWTATDLDRFIEIIESSLPIVKTELETDVTRDFEECSEGDIPERMLVEGGSVSGIIADPKNPDNNVFKFDYPGSLSTGYYLHVTTNYSESDAYLYEADYYMESASGGTTHQIQIRCSSGAVYMLTFAVSGSNVVIRDSSSINSDAVSSELSLIVPTKTWFKLGIEIYNDGTPEGFKVKVYLNGECKYISSVFYGAQKAGATPARGFSSVQIYAMRAPSSSLLVDNIHTNILRDKVFDDSDLGQSTTPPADKVTYDFESPNAGVTMLQNYPGSTNETVADPTSSGKGNVLKVTKSSTDSNYTDDYRFDSPSKKGARMTFSMDLYVASLAFADNSYTVAYQIAIGSLGAPAYMATLCYDTADGKLYLGDVSSTGSGTTNTYKHVKLDLGKWYNLKVVVDTASGFAASLYVDGELVSTSQNFYGSHTSGSSPSASRDFVNVRVQRRVKYEAYIDNVTISFE